ncbi:MAG: 50S ribosomal protein L10, partial [bacterium]
QGLTVAEISNLRRKLRPTGTICKVTKNTLMGLAIADLPSKEQLIAQVAGAINAIATKLARSINEVPASLARAVDAVARQEEKEAA